MVRARAAGWGLARVAQEYRTGLTPRVEGRGPAVRSYEAACKAAGEAPWPLEVQQLVEQLRGWAVGFCAGGGKPTSMATYMGRVIAHARGRGVMWGGAERELHSFMQELAEDFPHEVRRAAGVTEAELTVLVTYLGAMEGLYARMWTALLTTMWASMLRVGEACDTALRWNRVVPTSGGDINLILPWRKNAKGTFSRAAATFTIPRGAPLLDATRALRAYANSIGEEMGVSKQPVFVRRRRSGELASGTLLAWFNDDFRDLCQRAGVPLPPSFQLRSSHGLRRGSRTAASEAGVTVEDGGLVGGWKSDKGQRPYIEAGAARAAVVGAALRRAGATHPAQGAGPRVGVSGGWAQRTGAGSAMISAGASRGK